MIELTFYSTTHCHLCDEAKTLLANVKDLHDINWTEIEIATDDNLIELYGIRIPVIKRVDNNAEISWPFHENEIIDLIIANESC